MWGGVGGGVYSSTSSTPTSPSLSVRLSETLSVCLSETLSVCLCLKLQTQVYDILPSTTAVFSYAIGSRKLSANEQFFVGAQTVVRLLQTTQIKQT